MSALLKNSRNGVSMAKKIPICEPVNLHKYFTAGYIQRWTLVSTYLGADHQKSQGGGGELFPSHENVFVLPPSPSPITFLMVNPLKLKQRTPVYRQNLPSKQTNKQKDKVRQIIRRPKQSLCATRRKKNATAKRLCGKRVTWLLLVCSS